TTFLRTLVAKHGPHVPKALGLVVEQAVLFAGTYTTGCTFGTQGEAVTVAIIEGVHFFFDNIGHFTDRAIEQLSGFHYWKANFLISVALQNIAECGFHVLPDSRVLGQQIVHPANSLYLFQNCILKNKNSCRPSPAR